MVPLEKYRPLFWLLFLWPGHGAARIDYLRHDHAPGALAKAEQTKATYVKRSMAIALTIELCVAVMSFSRRAQFFWRWRFHWTPPSCAIAIVSIAMGTKP